MKIRVTLKDPDSMHDSVVDAVNDLPKPEGVDADEWEIIRVERAQKAQAVISDHWMEYAEYLTVEFDTEALTATVVPRQ